jgi:hypothetical protein
MSDTSDVTLAFAVDANPNTALPASIAWQLLNFVSEDLDPDVDTSTSKALRPDASTKDVRVTRIGASGSLAVELSRDPELDTLLATALRGAWVSNVLKAGVLKTKLVVEEKVLEGTSPFYNRFRGCVLGGFSLNAGTDGMVDITFPIQGMTIEDAIVISTTATYVNAGTTPVLAGVDFTGLTDSGLTTQLDVASVSFDMTNNVRSDPKMGSKTPRDTPFGRRQTTISASLYFASNEALQKFKAEGVRSVSFGFLTPGATAGITFTWPRCRATNYGKPIPGENQTIMVAVEFIATYDGTAATDFSITRTV